MASTEEEAIDSALAKHIVEAMDPISNTTYKIEENNKEYDKKVSELINSKEKQIVMYCSSEIKKLQSQIDSLSSQLQALTSS